jgi:DNA-binding NarL/FixJ family response regulator
MSTPIRVLIVDDHFTARIGLAIPINGEPDMQVIAEAENAREALLLYRQHQPTLVIMDCKMPGLSGIEAMRHLLAEDPAARVLMLSVFDGEEDIHRAMEAGAYGYLTKSARRNEVLHAIRSIAAGKPYLPDSLTAKLAARQQREPLIPREVEILRHIVHGRPNKEIAAQMHLSVGTINLHVCRILEKLAAPDRTRAATLAIERGIVHLG